MPYRHHSCCPPGAQRHEGDQLTLSQHIARNQDAVDSALERLVAIDEGITDIDLDERYVLPLLRPGPLPPQTIRALVHHQQHNRRGSSSSWGGMNLAVALGLRTVLLSRNRISSIAGVIQFRSVTRLSLVGNRIHTIYDCLPLGHLEMLQHLSLEHNPVTTLPHYRHHIITICTEVPTKRCRLKQLDGKPVPVTAAQVAQRVIDQEQAWVAGMAQTYTMLLQLRMARKKLVMHAEMARFMLHRGFQVPGRSARASTPRSGGDGDAHVGDGASLATFLRVSVTSVVFAAPLEHVVHCLRKEVATARHQFQASGSDASWDRAFAHVSASIQHDAHYEMLQVRRMFEAQALPKGRVRDTQSASAAAAGVAAADAAQQVTDTVQSDEITRLWRDWFSEAQLLQLAYMEAIQRNQRQMESDSLRSKSGLARDSSSEVEDRAQPSKPPTPSPAPRTQHGSRAAESIEGSVSTADDPLASPRGVLTRIEDALQERRRVRISPDVVVFHDEAQNAEADAHLRTKTVAALFVLWRQRTRLAVAARMVQGEAKRRVLAAWHASLLQRRVLAQASALSRSNTLGHVLKTWRKRAAQASIPRRAAARVSDAFSECQEPDGSVYEVLIEGFEVKRQKRRLFATWTAKLRSVQLQRRAEEALRHRVEMIKAATFVQWAAKALAKQKSRVLPVVDASVEESPVPRRDEPPEPQPPPTARSTSSTAVPATLFAANDMRVRVVSSPFVNRAVAMLAELQQKRLAERYFRQFAAFPRRSSATHFGADRREPSAASTQTDNKAAETPLREVSVQCEVANGEQQVPHVTRCEPAAPVEPPIIRGSSEAAVIVRHDVDGGDPRVALLASENVRLTNAVVGVKTKLAVLEEQYAARIRDAERATREWQAQVEQRAAVESAMLVTNRNLRFQLDQTRRAAVDSMAERSTFQRTHQAKVQQPPQLVSPARPSHVACNHARRPEGGNGSNGLTPAAMPCEFCSLQSGLDTRELLLRASHAKAALEERERRLRESLRKVQSIS